jgi:predicted DNA-binding transcriptional regulator AlpA
MNEKLLTAKETALILGLKSERTLNNWRALKRYLLPFVRVGRAIRYQESAIRTFIEEHTTQ